MRELVERGHLFIAQPPLYKISKGKQEQYLKDDQALEDFLTRVAVTDASLHLRHDLPDLRAEELEALVMEHRKLVAVVERIARAYPRELVLAMAEASPLPVRSGSRRCRAPLGG